MRERNAWTAELYQGVESRTGARVDGVPNPRTVDESGYLDYIDSTHTICLTQPGVDFVPGGWIAGDTKPTVPFL